LQVFQRRREAGESVTFEVFLAENLALLIEIEGHHRDGLAGHLFEQGGEQLQKQESLPAKIAGRALAAVASSSTVRRKPLGSSLPSPRSATSGATLERARAGVIVSLRSIMAATFQRL
jgi:hypothetical protein